MADKKAAAPKKAPFSVKFAVFMLLVLAVLFLPSTVVLCAGMLPTFVAAIVDDRPQKTAWITVGAINFAGVLPIWLQLVDEGHRLDVAFNLIMNPNTLLISYSAAAVGYFIYHQLPHLITGVIAKKGEKRLKDIEKIKKELIRKWGQEVTGELK